MKRFIETDEGDLIPIERINRIKPHGEDGALIEHQVGDVVKETFANLSIFELQLLGETVIPAQPGNFVCELNDPQDANNSYTYKRQIIAWRYTSWGRLEPITQHIGSGEWSKYAGVQRPDESVETESYTFRSFSEWREWAITARNKLLNEEQAKAQKATGGAE